MSLAMTAVPVTPHESPLRVRARPLALVAVVAFVIGFLAYVAVGRPLPAQDEAAAAVSAEPALASPASDDWNLPKHI